MAEVESMVRIGFVSDVRPSKGQARVCFPDMSNMVSDWLYVMKYPGMGLSINSAGAHSHGGQVSSDGGHSHGGSISGWFPSVNDKVLVLMAYGFNSDGYILGVIP